ncbi:MAG: hypothetical protein IJ219_03495 [Bacteroidaceae bacterium]|nr:hypothetical protein [Bacteroidaceae bacterium]
MLRKHYIAPSALVVVLGLNEGLLTSGSGVVLSNGGAVGDYLPTNDNTDNQFVKSHSNQWDDEW